MIVSHGSDLQGLLADAQTYAKQHPDQDGCLDPIVQSDPCHIAYPFLGLCQGIALFQQRVTMASVIMSDVQRPAQVLSAVKDAQ